MLGKLAVGPFAGNSKVQLMARAGSANRVTVRCHVTALSVRAGWEFCFFDYYKAQSSVVVRFSMTLAPVPAYTAERCVDAHERVEIARMLARTKPQSFRESRPFTKMNIRRVGCRSKTHRKQAHSKTVGCGEKLTGIVKGAEKWSPTNPNHKSVTSAVRSNGGKTAN